MTETILVVGASSAIGQAVVRRIAGPNRRILATYCSGKDVVDKLVDDLNSEVVALHADMSTPQAASALAENVIAQWGIPFGIVYLPAPKLTYLRFKELTWEACMHQMDMQVGGAVELLTRLVPGMAKARQGRVVFMLSSVVLPPPPAGMPHYVMTKHALLGLAQSMAVEYASKNVLINSVSPSMVETQYLSEIPSVVVEMAAKGHPLKRNATPADVAPVVEFLLSADAGYLNGVNIPVTGGVSI
jgi:NAD(P)-dependent dehydrogenase (short-subunit alcohol dehydrogenase family)